MTDTIIVTSLSALGLAPPALVLDVGCGTGLAARALARAGFRVVGADFDVDAVETARAMGGASGREGAAATTALFVAARAERLPFADAAFDAVVCLDVLHWAADETAFRRMWVEAWRVLRPGGVFAARCLIREENGDAAPLPGSLAGRVRLANGAEWFLPSRALLDDALAHGAGLWTQPPESAGTPGAARFVARKPG